jgi:hypothetical protein
VVSGLTPVDPYSHWTHIELRNPLGLAAGLAEGQSRRERAMDARVNRPKARRKARKITATLTAKRVSRLLRNGTPGRYLDRGDGRTGNQVDPVKGLYLVVNGKTSAHWELKYQFHYRTRHMGLGSATWSPASFSLSLPSAEERNCVRAS